MQIISYTKEDETEYRGAVTKGTHPNERKGARRLKLSLVEDNDVIHTTIYVEHRRLSRLGRSRDCDCDDRTDLPKRLRFEYFHDSTSSHCLKIHLMKLDTNPRIRGRIDLQHPCRRHASAIDTPLTSFNDVSPGNPYWNYSNNHACE